MKKQEGDYLHSESHPSVHPLHTSSKLKLILQGGVCHFVPKTANPAKPALPSVYRDKTNIYEGNSSHLSPKNTFLKIISY